MSLYKHKVCFFYSSFLAGKEAKEAGGTYDGSPLTPFQRPTGAPPLSVDPAQWDIFFVSHQAEVEKYRAGGKREKAKSGGDYPGQGVGPVKTPWPDKEAGTARPPPRYFGSELCGAGFSFLGKWQCWEEV